MKSWSMSVTGQKRGLKRFGCCKRFGGGFKEVGFALNCKLSEDGGNSIIWHFNRSYLEGMKQSTVIIGHTY